jgi:hypothetical protein
VDKEARVVSFRCRFLQDIELRASSVVSFTSYQYPRVRPSARSSPYYIICMFISMWDLESCLNRIQQHCCKASNFTLALARFCHFPRVSNSKHRRIEQDDLTDMFQNKYLTISITQIHAFYFLLLGFAAIKLFTVGGDVLRI